MKTIALIGQLIVGHPTERPVVVGGTQYTLRLTPLACDKGVACGTPLMPRRFRGLVFNDKGERVGMFDRPCVGVCEGLEKTVERAVKR